MPSYTIYAAEDDYTVKSENAAWATSRAGSGTLTSQETASATKTCGAQVDRDYITTQWFLHFDTSGVSGSLSAAPVLNVDCDTAWVSGDTFEAAEHTWSGTGTGNFLAGASLAADYGPTSITTTGYKTLTKAVSSLPISATYGILVFAQRQRTNTAPTTNSRVFFHGASDAGTTSDPYLSVTTVTSTNHPGAGAFTGSGTFAGAGLITRRGSAAFAGTGTFTGSGSFTLGGRAAFVGAGAFAGAGRLQASGQATFTGSGTFTGAGSMSLQGSASFAGVGTFAAGTAGLSIPGSASFYATSRFIANPRLRIIQRSIGRFPYPARQGRSVAFRVRGSLPSR